ncbi:mucin-5AC-like [Centruroides sculpturatus]|uniref:mucin-5AC-like n=1 Tax=Centruroides sculpturatus TaxID=218467 RepID=UPI000C6D78C2|nr:mucin-5AC-like [Centruroides sculpturatus]
MASTEESSTKSDGQLWTVWAESIDCQTLENEDDETEEEKKKRESDAMKLRQEDMPLFGFCPAWDEFYLVVCELCGYVVKPQALKNHIELRHGNITLARNERSESVGQHSKTGISNKNSSSSCQMAVVSGRTSSNISQSNIKSNSPNHPPSRSHIKPSSSHCHGNSSSIQLNSSHNAVTNSRSKSENPNKLKKNNSMAPFVRVERMPDDMLKTNSVHAVNSLSTDKNELPSPQQPPPNINISSLLNVSNSGITSGHASPSQLLPSSFSCAIDSGSSNSTVPLNSMGGDSLSGGVKKQSGSSKNKKVPRERKLLLCKDREYDPNKHCGVKVAETGKPCTRSLTCKTHSLSLRRAVIGRKKNFDELLADHRAAKEKSTQPQVSNISEHQTNSSCQISQVIQDSISIPNSSVLNSKCGSGTKTNNSGSGLPKAANKQVLKSVKHASNKATSPGIPVNRPSSHSGELTKPPVPPSETHIQQRLQECASETSAPKISTQDSHHISHHPRPAALCTFGLRQLGDGLFLLDRRWDLPRAAFRAAVHTERASHPPPLKKLCVESRLPPVPEPVDPSDPYSFSCSEPASSQPCKNLNAVMGEMKTVISSPIHSGLSRPTISVNNKSSLSNSSITTGSKPPHSKSVSNKIKIREKTFNANRNGSTNNNNSAKKKRNTLLTSSSNGGSNVARTSSVSTFQSTTSAVALPPQIPLLPLTIGDHLGALSQLQVSTHLVTNRNNLALSPAVVRSQNVSATLQSGTSNRGTKDSNSVVVTGVDILNGQLPVTSALLHSVTVSRPCSAMPTLLATPSGLGITVGAAGLQLSQLQKNTSGCETELGNSINCKGSNKSSNIATTVSGPNNNVTTICTTGPVWSSAKSKTKIRKPSTSKPTMIVNHTATVTHALNMGLLLESSGNGNSNNGGINNHTSPQTLSSPSATTSPLLRSDSVSPQVPVSSPLHNGLGPSPPPFLNQKSISSNPSGTSISNHASTSPASRTSTPSPSTDLSSPGSTGSGPKGRAKTDMELEGREKIEGCEHYSYLGIQIHQYERDTLEINTRLAQEAWRMTGEEKRKVEMDALRRSCRISKRERITNERIKDLMGLKEMVLEEIKRKQLILFGHDSVSPQVPVSSPLHNGLGPSPPPFLNQKSISSNPSGTSISNHASTSPASRTSTPSPSTDLSSPGSTGSGPKVKSSSRHSSNIQKLAVTSGSGHGTFHLSMPPPVNLSPLPVVTAGTRPSPSITYQQVFTSQMLTSAQLSQLQLQTVGKHNAKSTSTSSGPSSLTLATATMPLNFPGLLTTSGIVPTVSTTTQKQQQHPLLLKNEETRRTAVQMQGSPSLPT